MQLLAVELADFRNVEAALVEPHPRFNVLAGDNGQGKTNFLEAVYLLGTLRPFRAARLDELVRFGAPSARAGARLARGGLERRYDVEVWAVPPRKQARVDGKPVRAAADYFGGFNVVLFVPDDLRLPRGSPAARRRFVDRAVWNLEPAFLKEAQDYERVLRSRNALLRAPRDAHTDGMLAIYDGQLASAGAAVIARRRRYLAALSPRFAEAFARISGGALPVSLAYECPFSAEAADGEAALAAALERTLARARARDFAVGHTSAGPHTDDLAISLDGRPARHYASQGQLRALVLALKIAEIAHLAAALADPPILLLDDVSSELDPTRSRFLYQFLAELAGQVFITTTDSRHVLVSGDRRDFRVRAGVISPSGSPSRESAPQAE
jgi:DNA replication and repair protein RecF